MIKISVDEASAFDILSVQEIKISKLESCPSKDILINLNRLLTLEIIEQIGKDKFLKIYNSQEYCDLFNLNSNIFNLISSEKQSKDTKIQEKNHRRFLQKTKIQEIYFGHKPSEQKI